MVAFSFQAQFAAPILAGTKRQTIRGLPKTGRTRFRPGDTLQLYTGMRTRQCRKIGDALCQSVEKITIDLAGRIVIKHGEKDCTFYSTFGLDEFARKDGFPDWKHMQRFWITTHPDVAVFHGNLIRWTGFMPS